MALHSTRRFGGGSRRWLRRWFLLYVPLCVRFFCVTLSCSRTLLFGALSSSRPFSGIQALWPHRPGARGTRATVLLRELRWVEESQRGGHRVYFQRDGRLTLRGGIPFFHLGVVFCSSTDCADVRVSLVRRSSTRVEAAARLGLSRFLSWP